MNITWYSVTVRAFQSFNSEMNLLDVIRPTRAPRRLGNSWKNSPSWPRDSEAWHSWAVPLETHRKLLAGSVSQQSHRQPLPALWACSPAWSTCRALDHWIHSSLLLIGAADGKPPLLAHALIHCQGSSRKDLALCGTSQQSPQGQEETWNLLRPAWYWGWLKRFPWVSMN